MSQSFDLIMVNTQSITNNAWVFQQYIQWAPWQNQPNTINTINLSNATNNSAEVLGPLGDEADRWQNLYGKTKLSKVIVKYYPAQTQGMTGIDSNTTDYQLAASNTMFTIPIYDNVDDIISTSSLVTKGITYQGLANTLTKPYAKCHSIYKPWTRVIKPTTYLNAAGYVTADNSHYYKKQTYIDANNNGTTVNGLYICMPPLSSAGLLPAEQDISYFPAEDERFILGRLEFTYYQKFRTRT